MISAIVRAVFSVIGEFLKLILRFIEARPRLALILAGVAALLVLITSVAYAWLLLLGLALVGTGIRLRQQGH